jgi:hypothetical protein
MDDKSCKFFVGLSLVVCEIQSFTIAICSIDRLITVLAPFKYLSKNKMKFQIPLVVILSIVITACYSSRVSF